MTAWAHRFMVVPDAHAANARHLVKTIAPAPSADGMWTVGLSPTGAAPATHWISSGLILEQFAALMGVPSLTYSAYQQAGGSLLALGDVEALYLAATIRSDAQGREQAILASMGLKSTRE